LSVLRVDKLGSELVGSASLWRQCWQEHQTFDSDTRRKMLEVLAKTPGSSSIDPPPMDRIEEAVNLFLDESRSSDEAVLTAVKTIVDLVTRLLQFEWDASREVVKEGLSNVLEAADGRLRIKVKEHREVRNRLAEILEEELEKPWRIKLRSSADMTMDTFQSSNKLTFADWRSANVQWLCNSKFFAPSCCPSMLVGKQGVYESADHYMDTVHRLWVAMTFADGHAAMAPHCRSRGASGVGCNNALWPISGHLAGARCRTKGCSNEVEFACRIPKHDAFCGECAARSVARHLGKPGPGASTHLYDCVVRHVQSDGVLYLEKFKSRNPPPNVHWRTTKRLSPPNLVAIVRVSSKEAPLKETDVLKWAEIVYHGHTRDEGQRRERGDLALNISSIDEVDPDYFEQGANVVVVRSILVGSIILPLLFVLNSPFFSRHRSIACRLFLSGFQFSRHLNSKRSLDFRLAMANI
jgi:hypothetical protein